jgi:hypothetical protein
MERAGGDALREPLLDAPAPVPSASRSLWGSCVDAASTLQSPQRRSAAAARPAPSVVFCAFRFQAGTRAAQRLTARARAPRRNADVASPPWPNARPRRRGDPSFRRSGA